MRGQVLEIADLRRLEPGEEDILEIFASFNGLARDESGNINMILRALVQDSVGKNSTENNTCEFALETASIAVESTNPGQGESRVGVQNPLTLCFNIYDSKVII